jgi:fatty acid amide hydrolase
MQSKYICDLYRKHDLDCLLTPCFPVPSFQHGLSQKLVYAAMYTFVYNSLDFPTGVIPVSVVKKDEQIYKETHKSDMVTKVCEKAMSDSEGLPLGVQISTLPFEDE